MNGGVGLRAGAATPVCVDDPAHALVATGPLRLGRHPMYLGAVAVLTGPAWRAYAARTRRWL